MNFRKNKNREKYVIFIALLFLIPNILSAENSSAPKKSDFSLFAESIFGMKWGQFDEFVYKKNSGDYYKLSELNWQIKNMFSLGANVGGGYKQLKGKLHFSALIPATSGTMEDSDWLNSSDTSMKTTFSKSENEITQCFDFSAQIFFEFNPIRQIKIAPVLEFQYKTISFEARNGCGWYGQDAQKGAIVAWDDPDAKFYGKGTLCGIDYTRDSTLFWAGFNFEYSPISKIRLSESFLISPYAYTVAYDTHYSNKASTTGTDYADEVHFVFARIKNSAGIYYILNERFEFGLGIRASFAFEKSGSTYQKSHSAKKYTIDSDSKGGASEWEIDAAISCRINIF